LTTTVHSLNPPSQVMMCLSYLGLIPFVGLSMVIFFELFGLHSKALSILDIYSFGIIAFLCGSSWPRDGDDTQHSKSLVSNTLFLIAFISFILIPKEWLAVAAGLLVGIYIIEHNSNLLGDFNSTYKRLRRHLLLSPALAC
jgi:hypothetical protein